MFELKSPIRAPKVEMINMFGMGTEPANVIGIPIEEHPEGYMPDMEMVCQSDNPGLENPFKSEAQRKFMYAKHPEIAKRWRKEYGPQKNLPKKVGK